MFVYINNPKFFNDDRFSGKLIAGTIYIMHKEVSGENKKGHKIWRKVKDVDLGHGIWVNPLNRNNVICFNDTRGIYEVCIKNEKKKLNEDEDEDEDEILYDAVDVNDPRIQHHPKHAVIIQPSHGMEFGGTYLLLYCLYQFDYFTVLRKSLKDDRLFSQALVIISNNIQSGKEKIKPSTYYQSSIISYCVNRVSLSTIDSDTRLRQSLAVPVFKETFTENYVNTMRKKYPDFATCAAVDSMPYTSKAKNNPGVAKSSHGTGSVEQQIRVQKILDLDSGFPIWFDTFPGNSSDSVSLPSVLTSMQVGAHVFLNEMDLDAGYICRSLLNLRNLNNPAIISPDGKEVTNLLLVRLPTSDTYGLGEIYHNIRDELFDVNSIFQLNGSLYHGVKIKGEVLHYPEYIYFYVDVKRAYEKMIKILSEEQEAWDKLSEEEKQWNSIAGGVFMLASNNPDPSCTAKSTLCDYHKRYGIEADNRLQKTTVGGMPLGTHYDSTSNGEIMLDHMSTIFWETVAYGKK